MSESATKTVATLTEREDGSLERAEANGATRTFYPEGSLWLTLRDVQVWQQLMEPGDDHATPRVVTGVRGTVVLEDYGISVIGEPHTETRSMSVTLEAREMEPDSFNEEAKGFGFSFGKPLGAASVGFNRADWEVGNDDEWWMSCYLPNSAITALCESIAEGTLANVRLMLRLRELFSDRHPCAPPSVKRALFLRPSKSDSDSAWPEIARGYVGHLSTSMRKLEMPPDPPPNNIDAANEAIELPEEAAKAPQDQAAIAIQLLAGAVGGLRSTIKWTGAAITAALLFIAMR